MNTYLRVPYEKRAQEMHGSNLVIKTSCVDTLLVVSLKCTRMQKLSPAMTSATLSGNKLIQGRGSGIDVVPKLAFNDCILVVDLH